jgi:bacterioferritin-associated ferredoxin
MIVCHCNAVSDREVKAAAREGACELEDVQRMCGAGTDCAGCHDRIETILDLVAPRRPALQAS